MVLHDGRPQQVEAYDLIAQVCAKIGRDRFRNLDRRKLDRALPEGLLGQRRNDDREGLPAVKHRLDLPIPFHPLGKTHPAGALPRSEQGSHQRENAGGLDEHPGRTVQQMLLVQLGQSPFEIIVHQTDREVRRALDDANPQAGQGGAKLRFPLSVDGLDPHPAFLQILLRGLRRQAEARPVCSCNILGSARGGENVTAVEQPP